MLKNTPWFKLSLAVITLFCMSFGFTARAETVDINTADAASLAQHVKGIGPKLAAAIVGHREEFGPYRTLEDLARVKGVGIKLIERNRDVITVNARSNPVPIESDAKVLAQPSQTNAVASELPLSQ